MHGGTRLCGGTAAGSRCHFTETRRIGTSSVTVKVLVWAQRFASERLSYVTEVLVTLVAVATRMRSRSPTMTRTTPKAVILPA
jgi:acyl-CoA hydrolase